jgi:signal transduction histidine kinase
MEVSKRAAEVCDQVISDMGAEVHDDLIQKLSIFQLHLDRLERSVHNVQETEMLLIRMKTDFTVVVQAVRKISRKLMPVWMEDDSFRYGIELLCQNMESPGSGNVHVEHSGSEKSIPKHTQIYLYRMTQELIHNAFKHSSAWHIWVRVKWESSRLILEVEDDGTGFHRISEFIDNLRKKHNTLKMRSQAIGALLSYHHGAKGLLAKVEYSF